MAGFNSLQIKISLCKFLFVNNFKSFPYFSTYATLFWNTLNRLLSHDEKWSPSLMDVFNIRNVINAFDLKDRINKCNWATRNINFHRKYDLLTANHFTAVLCENMIS